MTVRVNDSQKRREGKGAEWLEGDVASGQSMPKRGYMLKMLERGDYRRVVFLKGGGRC